MWERLTGKRKVRKVKRLVVTPEPDAQLTEPKAAPEPQPVAPIVEPKPQVVEPIPHGPTSAITQPYAAPIPPRYELVDNPDLRDPGDDYMTPQKTPQPQPSEDELDDVDEDEFDDEEDEDDEDDEDEDDEEDDEDDDDVPPEPPTRPLPLKPKRPHTGSKETKYYPREDLKTLILEKYEAKWSTYDIRNWLETEGIADDITGDFLTIHQIGGFKGGITQGRRQDYIEGEEVPPPVQPRQPPVAAPPPPEGSKILVPRRRTNLETFYEMLEKAQATGSEALAQIAVDGIYKEMEKSGGEGGGGGGNDKVWALLTAILTENKGKSKLSELKELTEIVSNLMPKGAEPESEAVGMARVMSETAIKVAEEAKDTALQITGTKGKADKMGKCPNCQKLIPKDSRWCSYCGLSFETVDGKEEEEEEDKEAIEEAKIVREKEVESRKKREELAKRAVKKAGAETTIPTPTRVEDTAEGQPKEAVPTESPAPAPTTPPKLRQEFTSEQRAAILRNLKRLANFVSNKDNPILKTQALFKAGDTEDKKGGLLMAIIGTDRLIAAAKRLIAEHPDLKEFAPYVELCDSVDGKAWINASFEEIKNQSRLLGLTLKREEAKTLLDDVEAKLGFEIE